MVAWIALAFSLFATAVSISHLQRLFRFRKPIFAVVGAKFELNRPEYAVFIGPGTIDLEVRGSTHPVTITKWQVISRLNGRPGGGFGTHQLNIFIQPEVWNRLTLNFEIGMGFQGPEPPQQCAFEIYLSNPRDLFIVPFRLNLAGKSYTLDDAGRARRYMMRTTQRKRPLARGWRRLGTIFNKRIRG